MVCETLVQMRSKKEAVQINCSHPDGGNQFMAQGNNVTRQNYYSSTQ
jgi:hypothetical protein